MIDSATLKKALEVFEVPEEFVEEAKAMLTEDEMKYLSIAGKAVHSYSEMKKMIEENHISDNADEFINNLYKRAITRKMENDSDLVKALYANTDKSVSEIEGIVEVKDTQEEQHYSVTDLYTRFPYFAQFESEKYALIPKPKKDALNEWDMQIYINGYGRIIKNKVKGIDEKMHQNDFLTFDEAMGVLEKNKDFIYMLPCNCKMMYYEIENPTDVCVRFYGGVNTEYDRGHGYTVTLEEAKELVKGFNKKGYMQVGEGYSMCNCRSKYCYSIEMGRRLGAQYIYPRANYEIIWDEEKCINCGKCANICNFHAFEKNNGKVSFDPIKCWGCTICQNNCPTGAITLKAR